MYSGGDTPKGWVAPFGHPGIKACSQLPRAFRSVPRPSSPLGAKASTRCPSHARIRPAQPPKGDKAAPAMHRNHPRPHGTQRKPRRTASLARSRHTRHTHKTPLNPAAAPALGRSTSRRRSPGQTPVPAQPRTPRNRPEPGMRQAHAGPGPPEVSRAPRDAPEPDSQSPKNTRAGRPGTGRPTGQAGKPPHVAGAGAGRPGLSQPPGPAHRGARRRQPSP